MKIRYYGHSCFSLTSAGGKVLVTDPYESGSYNGAVKYPPVTTAADVALVSHQHEDHNHWASLTGEPEVVTAREPREVAGFAVRGWGCFHDKTQGAERGPNTMYLVEVDGLRLLHCGDLGHELDAETRKAIQAAGPLDVLFVPVGGFYTIDGAEAAEVVELFKPRVAIPMHYKTAGVAFPIGPVEDFLKAVEGREVQRKPHTVELTRETLPSDPEVWVLAYH